MKKFFMVVYGQDQVGIVSKITETLYKSKCNLEDISMTLLEGQFSMMLIFSASSAKKQKDLESKLSKLRLAPHHLYINMFPLSGLKRSQPKGKSVLISAMGKDRTGIVASISSILQKKKVNIVDLDTRLIHQGRTKLYALLLEGIVPQKTSLKSVQTSLKNLEKKLKVEISFKEIETANL